MNDAERLADTISLNAHNDKCAEYQRRLVLVCQERDAATRRAEVLEAERDEALRQAKVYLDAGRSLEAEVGRLREAANLESFLDDFDKAVAIMNEPAAPPAADHTETAAEMNRRVFSNLAQRRRSILSGETPPPAADHTERAREYSAESLEAAFVAHSVRADGAVSLDDIDKPLRGYIIATAYAIERAERAGAEKMRERAAKLCEPKHKPKVNMSRGEHGRIAASQGYAVYSEREQLAARIRALPLPGEE